MVSRYETMTWHKTYCNSLLARLQASTVNIHQRVQNAAARLICDLKPREHVTAPLQRLQLLPVKRVQYKLCMIMYTVHYGLAPSYITEIESTVAAQTSRPGWIAFSSYDKLCLTTDHVRSSENVPFRMLAQQSGTCYQITSSNTNDKQFQTQAQDLSFHLCF